MRTELKFCPLNFKNELSTLKNNVKQLPTVDVVDDKCLNYCGQCLVQPFALIDGKNICADSPRQLYEKIADYLASKSCSLPPL
jgi:uncharacterized protein YuzB (UPF0349 family)